MQNPKDFQQRPNNPTIRFALANDSERINPTASLERNSVIKNDIQPLQQPVFFFQKDLSAARHKQDNIVRGKLTTSGRDYNAKRCANNVQQQAGNEWWWGTQQVRSNGRQQVTTMINDQQARRRRVIATQATSAGDEHSASGKMVLAQAATIEFGPCGKRVITRTGANNKRSDNRIRPLWQNDYWLRPQRQTTSWQKITSDNGNERENENDNNDDNDVRHWNDNENEC